MIPQAVIELAAARAAGVDCAFALHDAMVEAGYGEPWVGHVRTCNECECTVLQAIAAGNEEYLRSDPPVVVFYCGNGYSVACGNGYSVADDTVNHTAGVPAVLAAGPSITGLLVYGGHSSLTIASRLRPIPLPTLPK